MAQTTRLSKNQIIKAAVAVLILAVSAVLILRTGGSTARTGSNQAYFYDLQTGDLFAAEVQMPPITTPAGGKAARAYVFSCGDCAVASERFTGYIETFSDKARAAMANPTPENDADLQAGHLIAEASTDPQWVPRMSEAGMHIESIAAAKCETIKPCTPQ